GGDQGLGDPSQSLRFRAVRLAEADLVPFGVPNHAGLDDVRREVGERSDDAARLDGGRDDTTRIDALEPDALELAADAVKIPPRDAVLRADDDRVGTEERAKRRCQRGETMCLDAEKHDVGLTNGREIAGDGWRDREVAVGAQHAQATFLHGAQMRTAR